LGKVHEVPAGNCHKINIRRCRNQCGYTDVCDVSLGIGIKIDFKGGAVNAVWGSIN